MGHCGHLLGAVFSIGVILLVPIAYVATRNQLNTLPTYSSRAEALTSATNRVKNATGKTLLTHFSEPCRLPDLDPWHPSIVNHLNPDENPLRGCHRVVLPISRLENGTVYINGNISDIDHYICYLRCLYTKSDISLEYGEWISINAKVNPDCDIVEIECKMAGLSVYRYMHAQIYELTSDFEPGTTQRLPRKADESLPDVRSPSSKTLRKADQFHDFNEFDGVFDDSLRVENATILFASGRHHENRSRRSAILEQRDGHVKIVSKPANESVRPMEDWTEASDSSENDVAATEDSSSKPVQPDVLLLIIDSVSTSQVIRSLPKTLHVLHHDYDAQIFRYLNKIGLNSRPNGFALLHGMQIGSLEAGVFYDRPIASEFPQYCKRFLDNGTFIADAFRRAGYRTMMAEDWAQGVFNWPDCKGFDKPPTDHYMRPFQLRLDGSGFADKVLKDAMLKYSCREAHEYVMDYLKQFTLAYKNQPKFSISWLSYLSHDSASGLYHADDDFALFFRSLKDQLNDAFLIVMADHGLRFGPVRATTIGQIEDNNPFLAIAVPQRLRKNTVLMENLRRNSRTLITHYDTYATMLDIAMIAPKSRFNDFSAFDFRSLDATRTHGSSMLRPFLDPAVRNCATLRIPFSYCICQFEQRPLDTQSTLVQAAGDFVLTELNDRLKEGNVSHICVTLKMRNIISAVMLTVGNASVMQVTIQVKPSNGTFEAFLTSRDAIGEHSISHNATSSTHKHKRSRTTTSRSPAFRLVSTDISRSNRYGGQSECTKISWLRPLCYCKNLLPQSRRVM